MKKSFIRAILVFLFFTSALSSYAVEKSVKLFLSGYEGTTVLKNFQVLVKLMENRYGFSYNDYSAKDGSDLWFEDSSGNLIPHEIDTWNADGDSFVWVRVPEVTGKNTFIVMHWGKEKTEQQRTSENVWKNYGDGNGGFAGVWHMNINRKNELDATGNGLTAERNGKNIQQMTSDNINAVVGLSRINQSYNFNSESGNSLKVSGYDKYISDAAHFTLCGWFHAFGTPNAWYRLFLAPGKWDIYHNVSSYDTVTVARSITIGTTNIADPIPDKLSDNENFVDNWCYVVIVFDGSNYKLYGNGRLLGSWTDKLAVDGFSDYFLIGNRGEHDRGWYGRYDEVRMYDGVQSEDRVKADYATMKSPETFLTSVTVPLSATWIGVAGDGNVLNAANWDCRNAIGDRLYDTLPTFDTVLSISGEGIYINASADVPLVCREVNIGDCTLGADCDLRGLTALNFPDDTVLDMNGHTLKVMSIAGNGMVTNSVSGNAADLYIYSSLGETNINATVQIGGNLRLVKDGEGGFMASKEHQTYTGGTLVNEGVLICGAYGTRGPFGTGSITIEQNGSMDMNGWVGYVENEIILNGGLLQNTREQVASKWAMWGSVRLTADSNLWLFYSYGFRGASSAQTTLDLGGHVLTVRMEKAGTNFQFYNTAILNGAIKEYDFRGFFSCYDAQHDIGSETFDFNAGLALNLERNMKVRDYMAKNKYDSNAGDAIIEVYGTFTPGTDHNFFHGCTMQSGSIINLSSRTDPLPIVSQFTNGANTLKFANGAVVKIKLGERKVSTDTPLISWEKGTDIGNVKFVCADDVSRCGFLIKEDGLYITPGLKVIVR